MDSPGQLCDVTWRPFRKSKIFVPNPKCSLFILYGLKQLINEPTRVTKFSSTLIDLIYTNYTDRVGCSEVSNIAISDHSVVYVYRRLSSDLPYFPSLTEIFEILIVKNFEMKCLRKTSRSMNRGSKFVMVWLKKNFCAFLTHMLLFELDVLNWTKHPGLIQPWRKVCAVAKREAITTTPSRLGQLQKAPKSNQQWSENY